MVATLIYMGDFYTQRHQQFFVLLALSGFPLAELYKASLAHLLLQLDFRVPIVRGLELTPWRVYILISVPLTVIISVVCMLLPQSPKFQLMMGEKEKAIECLRRIYVINTHCPADVGCRSTEWYAGACELISISFHFRRFPSPTSHAVLWTVAAMCAKWAVCQAYFGCFGIKRVRYSSGRICGVCSSRCTRHLLYFLSPTESTWRKCIGVQIWMWVWILILIPYRIPDALEFYLANKHEKTVCAAIDAELIGTVSKMCQSNCLEKIRWNYVIGDFNNLEWVWIVVWTLTQKFDKCNPQFVHTVSFHSIRWIWSIFQRNVRPMTGIMCTE